MSTETATAEPPRAIDRMLNAIEVVGNKLPDPAVLFVICLFLVWVLSAMLAPVSFTEIDPRSGEAITVNNLLTGSGLAAFLANRRLTRSQYYALRMWRGRSDGHEQ